MFVFCDGDTERFNEAEAITPRNRLAIRPPTLNSKNCFNEAEAITPRNRSHLS